MLAHVAPPHTLTLLQKHFPTMYLHEGGCCVTSPATTITSTIARACLSLSYHQQASLSLPVTPSLLLWVDVWVVLVTHLLPIGVELTCIFLKQVAGCEITPATKPGLPSNLQQKCK